MARWWGPAMTDGITEASATRSPRSPWTRRSLSTTASASTPILAVRRMSKPGGGCSREVYHVLPAGGVRTGNDLGFAGAIEGRLTAELTCHLDRSNDGGQVLIGPQIVAFDDGRVAPIGARQTHLAPARGLHERRGDREALR